MTPGDIHNFEQSATFINSSLVPMWAAMYFKLIEDQVPPSAALVMVQTWIIAHGGAPIHIIKKD